MNRSTFNVQRSTCNVQRSKLKDQGLTLYVVRCTLNVVICLLTLVQHAAPSNLDEEVREIALQLRCPVCQNLSVGDSPSELANEMRGLIREQLQAGKSRAEVMEYFVERYGEWILLAPPKRGFNLVVWVLPFVLIPVGGVAVYLGARRWVRHGAAAEPSAPVTDPRYAERLKRELDAYK